MNFALLDRLSRRAALALTCVTLAACSHADPAPDIKGPADISSTQNAALDFGDDPTGPPLNPHVSPSAWPGTHRNPAKQASTTIPGPVGSVDVQVRYLKEDSGDALGASPLLVLTEKDYVDAPNAEIVWGATLTGVYKYVVDGDRFEYLDHFHTSQLPLQLSRNLFTLSEGNRLVAPMPRGMRTRDARRAGCSGSTPAIAAFTDGNTLDSPIKCETVFEYTPERLQAACGFEDPVPYSAGNLTAVLYNGDIATVMAHDRIKQPRPKELGRAPSGKIQGRDSYLLIVDNDLSRIKTCELIGETGITNQFSVERTSDTLNTMYLATGQSLVAMQYDTVRNKLTRKASINLPLRERTGTTPTMLGFSGDERFVFLIDARCATANVLTGVIECDQTNTGLSRIVAAHRDFGTDAIYTHDLPDFIDTVENSPAVRGNDIVIANYSGYKPAGLKDGEPDFAKGIVKVSWNPATRRFQTDWANPDVQINGIPTISSGSNRVYSSGAEEDGYTYFYALRLNDDVDGPGGELVMRERVAISEPSRRGAKDYVFDQGNSTMIARDGSAIFPGGPTLVRVRPLE